MKKLIIAAGLIGAFAASAAQAQPVPAWEKGKFPYAQSRHNACFAKAQRLRAYEARATADHRLTRSERNTIASLKSDLDRTCGKFRWNG